MSITSSATTNVHKRECTAESRSTSAGSREGRLHHPKSEYTSSSLDTKLPEYDYPVPVIVRNTFINTPAERPESFEAFFEERRIHSSPAPLGQEFRGVEPASFIGTPEPQPLQPSIGAGTHAFFARVAAATGLWAAAPSSTEHDMDELARAAAATGLWAATPSGSECDMDEFDECFNMPQQALAPRLLMLSEALPEPEMGSQALPTIGSAAHYIGACKPCAFFYTKGCGNGAQCTFCHLCPPDEKRRRQKEKQVAIRELRRQRRQGQKNTIASI